MTKRAVRLNAVAALGLLAIAVSFASPVHAKTQTARLAAAAPGCTFETLSAEDRKRYQSRYKRRVRIDGKAYADAWLQQNACPTDEQRATRKQAKGKDGRPCKRTRLKMRVKPGFDGPMTMSAVPVCAD